MDREVLFGQTLEAVRKKAKEQGGVVFEKEVEEAFAALSLDEAQLSMIYDYLKKHGIGIGQPADPDDYLEAEDKNYLELYLQELSMLEQLTEGEKEALTLSAMAGDTDARGRLLTVYLPEAAQLARLYAGQGVLLEDLIGEANIALVTGMELLGALEHADEVQGMLGRRMMDAMEEAISESSAARDTGKTVEDKVNRVADAARELSEALLRKVTMDELSRESGIALEEIQEAVRLSARKIEELEEGNAGAES